MRLHEYLTFVTPHVKKAEEAENWEEVRRLTAKIIKALHNATLQTHLGEGGDQS